MDSDISLEFLRQIYDMRQRIDELERRIGELELQLQSLRNEP